MGNISRGKINLNKIEYIKLKEEINENDRIQFGDLFFNTRNTLDLVGKVAIWRDELSLAYYNSNLMRITFENNFFMNYRLNSFNTIKALRRIATGTTSVAAIYTKDLMKILLTIPNIDEQQKIASFLSAVDAKISLLSQKGVLLGEYKRGMMQGIFSQEIRFSLRQAQGTVTEPAEVGYSDWVETTLGKILTIGSGKDYKHLSDGNIPVYGTGGYMLSVDDYLYDGESVCIGRKGTIDKPRFMNGKFWTVDTLFYTHSFKDSVPKFVYYIFETINWKKYNEASGVPSLSKSTIEKIKINLPSLPEQTKIANFLSSIDKKIEQNTQSLEKMKTFKRGLLQGMFV